MAHLNLETTYGNVLVLFHFKVQETHTEAQRLKRPAPNNNDTVTANCGNWASQSGIQESDASRQTQGRTDTHAVRKPRRRAGPGGSPPDSGFPAQGPPPGAPDLPARRARTCLEVSAVIPRTRPPSREEKDVLTPAGPPTDWFCKKSPGRAVSVFSTMSLIAAAATARDLVAARLHAQPLPSHRPGLRRHFLFV